MPRPKKFDRTVIAIAACCLVLFALPAPCHASPPQGESSISCPIPSDYSLPTNDDLPRPANLQQSALFAWQQFLSLNQKANLETGHRGEPDSSHQLVASGETSVWQTYAHKVEMRPNGPLQALWSDLGQPDYGAIKAYSETITPGDSKAVWTLWNNLDEDNEIGSCNLYPHYRTQANPADLVLYQVKVNRDEYEYTRVNFGLTQHEPKTGALALAGQQVVNNIKTPPYSYYPGAPITSPADATCNCGPVANGKSAICLPCAGYPATSSQYPEGAIEVKSAWRRLQPGENADDYYQAEAIYYQRNPDGSLQYYNDTFALVGIHIIRKLANYPDFVFTTFEHVDVTSSDYEYALLDMTDGHEIAALTESVRRAYPIPSDLATVNSCVQASLGSRSVWSNYQLTGVQTMSVDCRLPSSSTHQGPSAGTDCQADQNLNPNRCLAMDPNYFMANFVIESDPNLNSFSGPGFGNNPFNDCSNTVFDNTIYNNGGCKGCHGVAQTTKGTDFSFILDFFGKPATEPDPIHYSPAYEGLDGPYYNVVWVANQLSSLHLVDNIDDCRTLCGDDCSAISYTSDSGYGKYGACYIMTLPPLYGVNFPEPRWMSYLKDGLSFPPIEDFGASDSIAHLEPGVLVQPATELDGDDRETIDVPASAGDDYCKNLCKDKGWCRGYSDCGEASERVCHLKGPGVRSGKGNRACTSGFVAPGQPTILDFQRGNSASK